MPVPRVGVLWALNRGRCRAALAYCRWLRCGSVECPRHTDATAARPRVLDTEPAAPAQHRRSTGDGTGDSAAPRRATAAPRPCQLKKSALLNKPIEIDSRNAATPEMNPAAASSRAIRAFRLRMPVTNDTMARAQMPN